MDTKGGKRVEKNLEVDIDIYTLLLLCIKQITDENLLYSTGNSYQCYVGDLNGQEIQKRGDVCIHIADYFNVQ